MLALNSASPTRSGSEEVKASTRFTCFDSKDKSLLAAWLNLQRLDSILIEPFPLHPKQVFHPSNPGVPEILDA
jgi:hypothetical protein